MDIPNRRAQTYGDVGDFPQKYGRGVRQAAPSDVIEISPLHILNDKCRPQILILRPYIYIPEVYPTSVTDEEPV